MQAADLPLEAVYIPIISDDVVRLPQPLLAGKLCVHDGARHPLVHAGASDSVGYLILFVAVNHQHAPDQPAVTICFEQQRYNHHTIGRVK